MYRIVGIWNNEEKYFDTPHNIGGQVLESIFKKKENFFEDCSNTFYDSKRSAEISCGFFSEQKFEVIFPNLFVNETGKVFSAVFTKENFSDTKKVIVIYDDIDMPFGKIKISFGRGSGGHNGIKDIEKKIKTKNFIKIKIGVCPLDFFGRARKPKKGDAVSKYLVSKKFSKKYLKILPEIEKKVEDILEEILKNGVEKTMGRFNQKK